VVTLFAAEMLHFCSRVRRGLRGVFYWGSITGIPNKYPEEQQKRDISENQV